MVYSVSKKILFNEAVAKLAKVNGLYSVQDLSAELAAIPTLIQKNGNVVEVLKDTILEAKIIDLVLNTYQGALTTDRILEELKDIAPEGGSPNQEDLLEQIFRSFFILYTGEKYKSLIPSDERNNFQDVSINSVLGYAEGQDVECRINSSPSNPTKTNPGLSVILSNNYMVGLTRKDTNPVTVFLNNIPNVEMNRCVPFVDLSIIQGRPSIHEPSKKLQSISLGKFLLGAEETHEGTPRHSILTAQPDDLDSAYDNNSVAGMELFTMPQALQNVDAAYDSSIRSNEVLDKFAPFLTLNDISLNAIPTHGLMSFKSGQIKMTLHDRSRLAEIADFIRVDLYGTTEIMLEYGWIHPDGEQEYSSSESMRNPYGDLINGMRIKELYHIINSSFSLTETGQVAITLQVAMRGGTGFALELIGSDAENTNSIIQDITRLQQDIAELRSRIFDGQDQMQVAEIRGIQILDSARDAMNYLSLPRRVLNELKQFEQQMRTTNIPGTDELVNKLKELFRETDSRQSARTSRNRGSSSSTTINNESPLTKLRNSVQNSIKRKLDKIARTPDPMLIDENGNVIHDSIPGRVLGNSTRQSRSEIEQIRQQYAIDGIQNMSVSLGKILLYFIGEPLANSNKFDDVQLLFYPFNAYAGKACGKNIANFAVDLEFFAESFFRWRLERLGQTANISLNEFMIFLQETIIDDPSARSYGLFDGNGAFFRTTTVNDGTALGVEAVDSPAVHMDRVNRVLSNVTPGGEFKMPQIEFFIENLPEARNDDDGSEDAEPTTSTRNILRIHVFDRKTSPYDSLGALLSSNRNSEITAIGNLVGEAVRNDNEGVESSMARVWNNVISAADNLELLEVVPSSNRPTENGQQSPNTPLRYRIAGGPKAIKNFLYDTMPYIRYGNIGSNVTNANLSSIAEPQLNTVNLLRTFRRSDLEPNGEFPGGLPMQIIPTETTVSTFGCPFVNIAQQFFIDFQTGTTADNIYGVIGVTHNLAPGSFTTEIKFCPLDAYGKYYNLVDHLQTAVSELEEINNRQQNGGEGSGR